MLKLTEWTWKDTLSAVIFIAAAIVIIVIWGLISSYIRDKKDERHDKKMKELTPEQLVSKLEKTTDVKKRCELVDHISDAETLAEIARNDRDNNVRLRAVSHLWDQDELSQIAEKSDVWTVRSAAVKKLKDPVALERIAAQDPESVVRKLAEVRLKEIK